MKELTIEQKAKAYDEAIKRAKELLEIGVKDTRDKMVVLSFFPELKESEDKKIKKEIISHLKYLGKYCQESMPNVNEWITWIEKQGEKPQGKTALEAINEEKVDNQNCIKPADELGQKFKVGDIVQYITDSTDRRKIEEIDTLCNMYYTDSSPIMFEVEDAWKVVVNAEDVEQEHTDKVEPKFHINDWIVHTETENIYQIVAIIDDKYQLKYGDNYVIEKCTDVDRCSRLWTIQDAKDGDIIVCPKYAGDIVPNIFIFKGIAVNNNDVYCHCSFSKAFISTEHYIASADSINTDFYPATKEQRDTLFKAMADAGYTFDFEKKVIKKRN